MSQKTYGWIYFYEYLTQRAIIGLHSILTQPDCTAKEQKWEYETNQKYLTKIIEKPINTMSHPCNSFNNETLNVLVELGVTLGFAPTCMSIKMETHDAKRISH